MRTRLACLCAALALLSCDEYPAAPRPEWMEPSAGSSVAPVPVVIHGEGFLLRPLQEQSGGGADLVAGHRAWLGQAELADVVWVDTRTLHATVPAGLAPGPKQLVVENAFGRRGALDGAFEVIASPTAVLEATLGATPATFNVGQPATLTLTVRNAGGAAVRSVVPEVMAVTGTAAAGASVQGPAPAAVDRLEPGAAATFTWFVLAEQPGLLSLAASARATDEPSSVEVASHVAEASARVQTPAALATEVAVVGAVRIGRPLAVTLTVRDTGEAGVLVTRAESALTPPGAATCGAADPSPPLPIAGLGSGAFSWSCTPLAEGDFRLTVSVAAADANSGDTLEAAEELRLRAR